jgi:NADPH-dependent 2,4-dienoyl-CoA reductase/sulfur reductase-like enzyme
MSTPRILIPSSCFLPSDPADLADLAESQAPRHRYKILIKVIFKPEFGLFLEPGPPATSPGGRHVIRTLDDALALRESLKPGARVVVLGAGFIGCEVAATARLLGCEVHCVAIDSHPMIRPLGIELAAELQRRHEEQGVIFHLGVGLTAFEGDEHVTGVVLSDGTTLAAHVVVEALGSRCNVEWLDGQGLDLTDGVLTDNALRVLRDGTPVDGVSAVGDVARFPNPRFDSRAWRIEHWNIPTDTGRRAAAVITEHLSGSGSDDVAATEWDVLPAFWSDQYEIRMQSYGMPGLADADGIRLLEGDLAGECVMGYHRGDDLVGVVGLGMLKVVNGYRDKVGTSAWVNAHTTS